MELETGFCLVCITFLQIRCQYVTLFRQNILQHAVNVSLMPLLSTNFKALIKTSWQLLRKGLAHSFAACLFNFRGNRWSRHFFQHFLSKTIFLDYTIRIPANFDVSEFLTRLMVSVCVCFAFVYTIQKRETQMERKLDSEPKKLSRRKDWICSKSQRAHPGKHDSFLRCTASMENNFSVYKSCVC